MELGLGIHGEPGAMRGPAQPADAVVDQVGGPCLPAPGRQACSSTGSRAVAVSFKALSSMRLRARGPPPTRTPLRLLQPAPVAPTAPALGAFLTSFWEPQKPRRTGCSLRGGPAVTERVEARQMLDHIAAGIGGGGGSAGGGLVAGARVALMVNSLGATAGMELAVAARAALARLAAMQARALPWRMWILTKWRAWLPPAGVPLAVAHARLRSVEAPGRCAGAWRRLPVCPTPDPKHLRRAQRRCRWCAC